MKNVILICLIFLFNSCLTVKSKGITNSETASNMIFKKINFVEKQFLRYEKGKKADFSQIEKIVNLSNIIPKNWSGNWSGIVYIPNKNIIKKWKKWYFNNKDFFYFEPNNDYLLKLHLSEKERYNVIFIKTKDGLVRNSLSFQCLCEIKI